MHLIPILRMFSFDPTSELGKSFFRNMTLKHIAKTPTPIKISAARKAFIGVMGFALCDYFVVLFFLFHQLWPGLCVPAIKTARDASGSSLEYELRADGLVVLDLVDDLCEGCGHGDHFYLALVHSRVVRQRNCVSDEHFAECGTGYVLIGLS